MFTSRLALNNLNAQKQPLRYYNCGEALPYVMVGASEVAVVDTEQGGGSGRTVAIRRERAVDLRTEEHLAVFLAAIAVCIDDNS